MHFQKMVGLSVGEKHFIHGGIAQDVRSDDQEWLTYRPIFVETGVIPQVEYCRDASLKYSLLILDMLLFAVADDITF